MMNNELTLVLGMLDNGLINVDQTERLILRLRRATAVSPRRRPDRLRQTNFIPPHFPSGFGAVPIGPAV